jgi:hypothetical protein
LSGLTKKLEKKKRQPLWFYDAFRNNDKSQVGKLRSKTFPGIAKAMANQWGQYLNNLNNLNN